MKPFDPLFAWAQEEDERAIWELRRHYDINDDDPDGWKTLSLLLAREKFPGFPIHKELARHAIERARHALVDALKGKAKLPRGRPPKWGDKELALLLDYAETWTIASQRKGGPKRTIKEAFKALKSKHPGIFKDTGVRRLCNLVSDARGIRLKKAKRLALVDLLKRSHGK